MSTACRFPLGNVVATPAALQHLESCNISPSSLLHRHQSGDWGAVCPDDAQVNEDALRFGDRLLSSYAVGEGAVWIITEADRSVTTLLLPEDY